MFGIGHIIILNNAIKIILKHKTFIKLLNNWSVNLNQIIMNMTLCLMVFNIQKVLNDNTQPVKIWLGGQKDGSKVAFG